MFTITKTLPHSPLLLSFPFSLSFPLQACYKAVEYINRCCAVFKTSLDGKNLETVLLEFGSRLHRVIYDHLLSYTVNESGRGLIYWGRRRRKREAFRLIYTSEVILSMDCIAVFDTKLN